MSQKKTYINRRQYSHRKGNRKYYYACQGKNAYLRKNSEKIIFQGNKREDILNEQPKKDKIVLSKKYNDWRKSYKPVYETNVKYVFKPFVLSDDVIEYILNL